MKDAIDTFFSFMIYLNRVFNLFKASGGVL